MRTLTLLLAGLFFLSSCGGGDSKGDGGQAGGGEGGDKVIGITVMDLGNPFFVELTNAAKEEAEKHGYKAIVLDGDAETQKKQIDEFINDKVAAISVIKSLLN